LKNGLFYSDHFAFIFHCIIGFEKNCSLF